MAAKAACARCPALHLRLCEGAGVSKPASGNPKIAFRDSPAKSQLYRDGEYSNEVLILCRGWAFRYIALPSGRRQILDFVLPGDLMPSASWYRKYFSSSIQSLTSITYAQIDRLELESYLHTNPLAMHKFIEKCAAETDRYEQLLADMGQRSAVEAVARQVISLKNRLAVIGEVADSTFNFPVRQQHIADLLGISQIHANRVLGQLRRDGYITIKERRLRIDRPEHLARLAGVRDGAERQ